MSVGAAPKRYASQTDATTPVSLEGADAGAPTPLADGTVKGTLTMGDDIAGDWTEALGDDAGDWTEALGDDAGDWTEALGDDPGDLTGAEGEVTAGSSSSSSQNGISSADTFGGFTFGAAPPFPPPLPPLTFDTVITKVVLGVLSDVPDEVVVFVLVVVVVFVDDVLFPKTLEVVELDCNNL